MKPEHRLSFPLSPSQTFIFERGFRVGHALGTALSLALTLTLRRLQSTGSHRRSSIAVHHRFIRIEERATEASSYEENRERDESLIIVFRHPSPVDSEPPPIPALAGSSATEESLLSLTWSVPVHKVISLRRPPLPIRSSFAVSRRSSSRY